MEQVTRFVQCPEPLEQVWGFTGVKESCGEYLDRAEDLVPDLKDFDEWDAFLESLQRRGKCAIDGKDWCGSNAPLPKIEGEYEMEIGPIAIYGEKVLQPPPVIVDYIKREVYPDAYVKTGDRRHVYRKVNGREIRVKIARILDELREKNPELWRDLYKIWTSQPIKSKRGLKPVKVRIKITTDPIAIARKSTGQVWTSCETIGCGEYDAGIFSDIKNWNAIAYIYLDDNPIPSGRVMLRHCRDNTGKINIGVEPRIYGDYNVSYLFAGQILKKIKEILKEHGYGDFEWCETPYIYYGYSDEEGHGVTQICYGVGRCPRDVEEYDDWVREHLIDIQLNQYDYYRWVHPKYDGWEPDSFWDLYRYENVKDLISELIDQLDFDSAISVLRGEDPLEDAGYYEAAGFEVRDWALYPEMIKSLVRVFKDNDVKYGVVTNENKAFQLNGTILNLYEDDPDRFNLYDWKGEDFDRYKEFGDKYIEFLGCIESREGKEMEAVNDVEIEEGKIIPKTYKMRYSPAKIRRCLESVFGVTPLKDVAKSPRLRREFEDEMRQQIEAYEKYKRCREEGNSHYECVDYIENYSLSTPYEYIDIDPDEVKRILERGVGLAPT